VALGFGFERVGIVRFVPEGGLLRPFVAHGLTSAEVAALPASLPASRFSAFQRAAACGRTVYVETPGGDEILPEEIIRGFGLGSFVIVPLIADGHCLGFVTCDQRGERFSLDASELDLLTTFGTLIAAFLEKIIAQSRLRRLNELKSQFAAIASHELRTPVAAIYAVVQTLDARQRQLTPARRSELRRMLSVQSKRLLELVNDLLDLSRLEFGSVEITPTEFYIRERLAAIVETLPGREIRIDVPADMTTVADAQAFDRIATNILANAVQHGAPPIIVSAKATRQLELCVEDHGPGIAGDLVASIFDPFTRGQTRRREGAGLGLSIAQSYAHAHGGTLTYEHLEPHGACFRLSLPTAIRTIGVFGQVIDVQKDEPSAPNPVLTPRQVEVLLLLERGHSTSQIAHELQLSIETVRNHINRLLRALGVHSRLEAVALARDRDFGPN
jgi:signal transduction histidine kinase/DNA-binding CsgD family transcriptional regulator